MFDNNSDSFQRYRHIGRVSPVAHVQCMCLVCLWNGGWSVEVNYWRTLRRRGRRAEGSLCLSLPGRWNKLKSIGNTFCLLTSFLIMDTKHISGREMPVSVRFYVIVYLIHISNTLYKTKSAVCVKCSVCLLLFNHNTSIVLFLFFLPF